MKRFWKETSEKEKSNFANSNTTSDQKNWIAVLPLGATEQHGQHLPAETDSLIAAGIVERLAERLPTEAKITFLPVEEIGYSPEHLDYSGSLSLSYVDAIQRWLKIGAELNSYGIRKLVLLNAHGGNSPLMTIVATELRVRYSMLAVGTSWTRFGTPSQLIEPDELAFGIHGGDIETSVMLAMHPEKVRLEKLKFFPSFQEKLVEKNQFLRAYGKHAFGWKMQDLNPQGVVGNAAIATVAKGQKLIDHSIEGLLKLIEEVDQFDIACFDQADHTIKTD
jgi:creatinine amidohydrolase